MLKVLSIIALIIAIIVSNNVDMNVNQIFVCLCAITVAVGTTFLLKTSK